MGGQGQGQTNEGASDTRGEDNSNDRRERGGEEGEREEWTGTDKKRRQHTVTQYTIIHHTTSITLPLSLLYLPSRI
jgi:hypothetical protein